MTRIGWIERLQSQLGHTAWEKTLPGRIAKKFPPSRGDARMRRQRLALMLRNHGMVYREIGRLLSVTGGRASEMCDEATRWRRRHLRRGLGRAAMLQRVGRDEPRQGRDVWHSWTPAMQYDEFGL